MLFLWFFKKCVTFKELLMSGFSPDEVKSILDFEDACSSYLVFECGSLLMYTFAYMPKDDFGQLGAAVMRGFVNNQPLTQPEWDVLYDAVIARLIQSSLYGLYGALLTPENAEYILESQNPGWLVLCRIWNMDREKLLRQWQGKEWKHRLQSN